MTMKINDYFLKLNKELNEAYSLAQNARSKGFDPAKEVEILLANNLAERVEGLISTVSPQIKGSGVVERIAELEEMYGNQDWRIALKIAEEISMEKFCKFEDKREAMEVGIRFGIAYVTVGVVSSPLEGFTKLDIRKRRDGKEYFALFYSGPIRSAGGTASSVSLVIADYVRVKMGYDVYDPDEREVKRMSTELRDYHERVTNLQYFPSEEEIHFMVENLPVQVEGDPSEKYEVSNYKDLDRVDTNIIRNGVCLVLGEGICQKAPKIWKQLDSWGEDFDLDWKFLGKFLSLQKKIKAKGEVKGEDDKLTPDYTFIKDLVAGRPVLSHPLAKGGFRLRYGRSRVSGFSSDSIHPATMVVLENYIGNGTQLKTERPGKSTTLMNCDSIEGPIVKLKDGSVVFLDTEEEAREKLEYVDEVIFLGDFLVNYGDFFNRAHKLVTPGYCEEWWFLEFEKAIEGKGIVELNSLLGLDKEFLKRLFKGDLEMSCRNAIVISKKLKIPLHPRYTFHFKDISKDQLLSLYNWLKVGAINRKDEIEKIVLPLVEFDVEKSDPKRVLELLGVPHVVVAKEHVVIEKDNAMALAISLGFFDNDFDESFEKIIKSEKLNLKDVSEVKLRDKSGVFVGARMGRPEKAKMRKLTGNPHVLFPVGDEGGRMRSFQSALQKGNIKGEFPIYKCNKCETDGVLSVCVKCNEECAKLNYCRDCNKVMVEEKCERHGECLSYKQNNIDINFIFRESLRYLGLSVYPDLIKGVRGTSNDSHFPEHIAKGILRAGEDVSVNRDGTVRYDMTEMTITHFKPNEIGTSVEELKELGYDKDVNGNDLVEDSQVLEILPQDIILPACDESPDEGADEVLFRVSKFIDNLLSKFYRLNSFYNLGDKRDLVGHLVLAMSPHTSAGILGRIIGFSKIQGLLAHPYLHSIMRRDCDGDEACVVLLMDSLLNFSRKLLPGHRGARQDAPLVLTTKLIPKEVDDMIFDLDVVWRYPLEFYEATEEYKDPWDVKLEQVEDRLGKEGEYTGFGFTHSVSDINAGVRCSAYKYLPTMKEKVYGQMRIAEKVRAVDEGDVARLVIERHFMRDIRGNLRKFSQQQFRCVDCNEKYRRPPLIGICTKCNGKIIFTISEGSIVKYVEPAMSLVEKYELPAYLKQSLEITNRMIESTFSKDPDKQEGLGKWFSKQEK